MVRAQTGSNKNRAVDSINRVISTAKHDSTIINAWKTLDGLVYLDRPEQGLKTNVNIDSLCSLRLKGSLSQSQKKYYTKHKAYALNNKALYYTNIGDYKKAMPLLDEALSLYQQIKYLDGIAAVYINKGRIFQEKYENHDALVYLNKALQLKKKLKDKDGIAIVYLNIGNIYYNQGNFVMAIQYTTKSLQNFEAVKSDYGASYALNNIGLVYHEQQEYDKAIESYTKSLNIRKKLKDISGMGGSYNNLGLVYQQQKKYDTAKKYYNLSYEYTSQANDLQGRATALHNLGFIAQEQGDYTNALPFLEESLKIKKEIEDQGGICDTDILIGLNYVNKKNRNKAMTYFNDALNRSKKYDLLFQKRDAAYHLKEMFTDLNDSKRALEMYEVYIASRDSIASDENKKEVIKQEYKYQYEKQAAADRIKSAEEKKVKDAFIAQQKAELRAKRNQQYMLFGGLTLVIVFSVFIFNRFRLTQKQKAIIEHQKIEVEEKNKEITDSINYARRIQTAVLPPNKIMKELLPESFVLYKPKDIVAGDFYWLEKKGSTTLFAACDCTGHGVPGAMVSVICNNGLNRSVREHGLTEPGKILDKTREIVIQEFEKSEEEVKDGMDVSLVALTNGKLQWAGANNPLWIIRNNELIELKPDKQPIGKYASQKPFTTHELDTQKGDSLYIFTDGFQDQFGGEKEKKFKAAKLKELLLSVYDKPMNEQKQIINNAFEKWKSKLEQNDDVCIIGVRI